MRTAWNKHGVLILDGFVPSQQCVQLQKRAMEIVDGLAEPQSTPIFETQRQSHAADPTFMASADRVECFYEEEATCPTGGLTRPKRESVNNIGHALHDLDPVFDSFSRHDRVRTLVQGLGITQPRLVQSMVIFKPPQIGGEVTCHQDASFLRTRPCTVIGLWFALQPAHIDNGCLWVLPTMHTMPPRAWFGRKGHALEMVVVDPTPWPLHQAVPVEAEVGTLVVLHGQLPHFSHPNRSQRSRHAYALHIVDGNAEWLDDNWLQPTRSLRGF